MGKFLEKAEHPRDSAELEGETNVWPREGKMWKRWKVETWPAGEKAEGR